jgi:ankyrin repeat protein
LFTAQGIFWKSRGFMVLLSMLPFNGNLLANIFIEDPSVQAMHQTVLEFFRPGGPTEGSRFQMAAADAHTGISIACIQYLLLCLTNTRANNLRVPSSLSRAISLAICGLCTDNPHSPPLLEERHDPANPPGTGTDSWVSRDFEEYARYLNDRPFIVYILGNLKEHLPECRQVEGIPRLLSQLSMQFTNNPMCYLLGSLVTTNSSQTQAASERQDLVKDFLSGLALAATRMGFSGAVEASLEAGADTEGRLDDKTLLLISAQNGDQATARVLLDRGAGIEAIDNNRHRALHLAAANGHDTMVRLLADRGADREATDGVGHRGLHLAAENGRERTVQVLIENLAVYKEAKNVFGWTALHIATMRGYSGTVRMLIERLGVNRHSKDDGGNTPLHLAAALGLKNVVQLLVTIPPVNRECLDDEMKKALDLALERSAS